MGSTADSNETPAKPSKKGAKFNYEVGQRVLCMHQHQMYDAKILSQEWRGTHAEYLVHYQGWNKKWDEHLTDERIFEHNDVNVQKAKDMKNSGKNSKRASTAQKRKSNVLNKSLPADSDSQSSFKREVDDSDDPSSVKKDKASEPTTFPKLSSVESSSSPASEKGDTEKSKKSESSAAKPVNNNSATGGTGKDKDKDKKKQPTAATDEEEEIDEEKLELLGIELPNELAKLLVDDWESVEVRNMLVQVPAPKTVDSILRDYIDDRKRNFKQADSKNLAKLGDWVTEWSFRENAAGIKRNFNHIFGAQNLYRIERLQYAEILKGMETENKQEAKKNPAAGGGDAGKKSRASRTASADDFPNRIVIEFDFTLKYGAIHLLRSFLQFDHVLVRELRPDIHETTLAFLQDFLEFLNDRRDDYFSCDNYFTPPLEYSRKALNN